MLSVIIPARNEFYLQRTIDDVLSRAEGEIEVITICDGYWPDPPIQDNPRVVLIHHTEARGQRQSINEAARIARGEFIMKLDAHCAVDQGFDVKLAADCEYDWTVIPRMYNLDKDTWLPKLHKRTDYMYIGWNDKNELRSLYYNGHNWKHWHRKPELVDDTMGCMGPCFFMHKDRFWELGGCDENHGSWGQQGIEVALKAWLSGGRLVVNKKTWFAHWFRGDVGFPYHITGHDVSVARRYSMGLWLENKWPQQVNSMKWLIDKFNPPTWENREAKELEGGTIMDQTNRDIMTWFVNRYLRKRGRNNVLDVGSFDVNGNFRDIFARHIYTGADVVPGPNVDIVLEEPYKWQFGDNQWEVIVSGSTIEHMEYPWLWFKELYRVLMPDGLVCIIAPAAFKQHRYPIDTYRYYPDGMKALAKWCGLTVLKTGMVRTAPGAWSAFTYMVAKK